MNKVQPHPRFGSQIGHRGLCLSRLCASVLLSNSIPSLETDRLWKVKWGRKRATLVIIRGYNFGRKDDECKHSVHIMIEQLVLMTPNDSLRSGYRL